MLLYNPYFFHIFAKIIRTKVMEFVYLLGGLAAGAIMLYLLMKGKITAAETLLQAKVDELIRIEETHQKLMAQKEESHRTESEKATLLQTEQAQRINHLLEENKMLTASVQSLQREIDLLQQQSKKEHEEAQTRFEQQLKMVQEQLQNATQEILRQRAQELTKTNSTQMDAIITPLKDTIREMKTAMDNSRDLNNKNTASLEKAIEEMMKKTGEIGLEADKLAHALTNKNKVQGNWGELILDEVLSSQGLVKGVHYETQVTLRDKSGKALQNEESGKRMIPDAILHFPDGKDAILDSKVSLSAFVDYQNAENEDERTDALSRHIKSIRQHVIELKGKNYNEYIQAPRQALNYVIMFVPNESALQLALYNDTALWREAFEKGIFITSEQNLIAALRMIHLAWTQVKQAENQEQIMDTARMLLDRVSDFFGYFEDMGKKLEDATATYRKASDKLRDGRQSVAGISQKLHKLGVKMKPNKQLPEEHTSLTELE